MDTRITNFARNLTKDERKDLKEYGELSNVDMNTPLLSWSHKPYRSRTDDEKKHGRTFNTISFTETWENSLIQTENDEFVALKEGIVIAITTEEISQERLYFFEICEYEKALDFYNKMTVALQNNNHF